MSRLCGNRPRMLKRNCSIPPSMLLMVKKVHYTTSPHPALGLTTSMLRIADTLQRGKIKNKVLKLTGLSQVRKIDVSYLVSSRLVMAE